MSITNLAYQIEKLIQKINTEEEKYIASSMLNELSPTQIHYIDVIYHEENLTTSELARLFKVTKPTVTNTIEKLETLGFVFKTRSESDGRIQYLHLTEKGMEISQVHEKFHHIFTKKFVGKLQSAEIEQLSSILTKALGE